MDEWDNDLHQAKRETRMLYSDGYMLLQDYSICEYKDS